MSRFRDAGFIFELGFVFAIYFAFIFVYLLFSRVFTVFAEYLVIAVLVSVTVFLFYRAYLRRQVFAFFIGFTVIGLLLFSLSTVVALPHTATESYAHTASRNFYNNTITLNPYESKNISSRAFAHYYDFVTLWTNGTVVQLRFSNNIAMRIKLYFTILDFSDKERLGLEHSHGAMHKDSLGEQWVNVYWAPMGPLYERPPWGYNPEYRDYLIRVVLENLDDSNGAVLLNVDYFNFLATSTRFVTRYRSAIDPHFGYFGAGLIVAAVTIEFWAWHRTRPIVKKEG
jgi:hypothetical protein